MTVEGCEALQGCDTRTLPVARVRTGAEMSPVAVTLLGTTVHRLNERGLAWLIRAAQAGDWTEGRASWKEIRPLWARASESTLDRAARCPMVLVDLNFQCVAWWIRVINSQPCGDSGQPRFSTFHTDEALSLARDLLLEAWSAARSTPNVSSLVFGMAPEVTSLIARLSPRDLERVVVYESKELRPRWENRPMLWKALFHAATQMNDQLLANVHLHCLQLLGGELVSMRGKPIVSASAAKRSVREATVQPELAAERSV
jgi:hypothetical protein